MYLCRVPVRQYPPQRPHCLVEEAPGKHVDPKRMRACTSISCFAVIAGYFVTFLIRVICSGPLPGHLDASDQLIRRKFRYAT